MDTELALNNLFILPRIAFVGEYVKNMDSDIVSDDEGFLAGIKIGAKKVKKSGQWQAFYSYRRLEKDAFLDVFPDSDFYSGETDVKGYEVILQYGLKKNLILGLDYYETCHGCKHLYGDPWGPIDSHTSGNRDGCLSVGYCRS